MPRPSPRDGLNKFQRHRASRRAQGFKLVRVWVTDPQAVGFSEEAHRQAKLLQNAPEESEALAYIEGAADWIEGST